MIFILRRPVLMILSAALAVCLEAHAAAPLSNWPPEAHASSLFSNGVIPHVDIAIPPEALNTLRKYRWKWGGNQDERVSVKVTVREGDQIYTNVSLHLKGAAGSFRSVDQNPAMTLNFDKFAHGQRFRGLSKLSLNNSVQDRTYVSERLCRELFTAAGVPAPRADHARVKLNGRDLGLYVVTEGWGQPFLKQHFSNPKGHLYDGGFAKEITDPLAVNSGEDPPQRSDLQALAAAARERNLDKRWERLQSVLDMDGFISFMALDALLWNWDSYTLNRNNYRVFQDLDTGHMVFLPHGMDQMFWRPEAPIMPGPKSLVGRAVMATREGRKKYLARFAELADAISLKALTNRVYELATHARPELSRTSVQKAQAQDPEVEHLCALIVRRMNSVSRQLAFARQPLLFTNKVATLGSNWVFRTESGRQRSGLNAGSPTTLSIAAAGPGPAEGSWAQIVWLERGRYRLEGKIKTLGVVTGQQSSRPGAGFWVFTRRKFNEGLDWDWFPFRESQDFKRRGELSLRNDSPRLSGTSEWTPLHYEFEFRQPAGDVELHCDLQAAKGEAKFDLSSLKVIRID